MSVMRVRGSYSIDWYTPDGKRHRKKIGPDKRIATTALKEIEVKIAKGEYLGVKEEQITFKTFAVDKYWPAVQHTFSEQERIRAKSILDLHLIPHFGGDRLSRISRQQIDGYLATRAGQVKAGTVNKEFIRLRHLLGRAVVWGYLKGNPTKGVTLLKEPPARVKYLVPEQVDRLLESCGRHSLGLWAIVTLAMHTGMRQGEILGLTWADVDLQATPPRIMLHTTKNNESRVVPLNAEAVTAVTTIARPSDSFTPVFPGWTRAKCTMSFVRASRQAGIADFRFHDLRHHAASWLSMKGVNQRTIEILCGWKDPRTARRYQHVNNQALYDAVATLSLTALPADAGTHVTQILKRPHVQGE